MDMARRPEQLALPCATAESGRSRPRVVGMVPTPSPRPALKPVTFINGFQKRLGVYSVAGPHETTTSTASDSESDMSSLEIDSNLSSDSSLAQSNPVSPTTPILPLSCAVSAPDNNFTAKNLSSSDQYSEGMAARHNSSSRNLVQSCAQELDNNNSFKQPNLCAQITGTKPDRCTRSLVNGKTAPTKQQQHQKSPTTVRLENEVSTAQGGHPLVLKIRRRTWTDGGVIPGDANSNRADSDGRIRTKSSSELGLLECRRTMKDEWQSVSETHVVYSSETKERDETANTRPTKTVSTFPRTRPTKKKHRHHKLHRTKSWHIQSDTPFCQQFIPHHHHQKEKHSYTTKQRKGKETASRRKRFKLTEGLVGHSGQTLRLPSDPQKAVKVLEKALESINAQIKQLKRETKFEKRATRPKSPRSHRKGSSSGGIKKRRGKRGKTKHSKACLPSFDPGLSRFKLSEFFPVVPSLIVRDNDLQPAYKTAVDPNVPPLASHPIWHWTLGQPPLPKTATTPNH